MDERQVVARVESGLSVGKAVVELIAYSSDGR